MSLCQSESEVADAATALGADAGSVTPRKKGTIMNSTKVLSTDTSGRTPRVDIGWPARDERLVTVAEPLRRTEVQRARTPGQQSETSWVGQRADRRSSVAEPAWPSRDSRTNGPLMASTSSVRCASCPGARSHG